MSDQKITPFLWFDRDAEAAANFYVSVFDDARIVHVARYGKAGAEVSGHAEGAVMTVSFELDGVAFLALNGGPAFPLTPAVSFVVNCRDQHEIDRYCAWPGQACGYQIGHLYIDRLRTQAKAALGARFDLKGFDDAVLTSGSLPLSLLDGVVDAWTSQARRA